MSEQLTEKIIEILTNSEYCALSATAVSQECGYTKKTKTVSDILDKLLEDGVIAEQYDLGGVRRYTIVPTSIPEEAEECTDELTWFSDVDLTVPDTELHGYNVRIGSKSFKVENPDSRKVYELPKSSRLLVINFSKHIEIRTPESLLAAIQDYANRMGYGQYCISTEFGVPVGEITSNPQYYNSCVIFTTVSRQNKSGS